MKLIRNTELQKILGVSRATIWRWRKNGVLPTPINLGPRLIGWKESDINNWLTNEEGYKDAA